MIPETGNTSILDFNPRTWGWHNLGTNGWNRFYLLVVEAKFWTRNSSTGAPRKAAWLREITDFMAIAKSMSRVREIKNLLDAIWRRKFKLATFSLSDPVPFFAEFFLLLSSGLTRQKQAKDFLNLNSNAVRPEAASARTSELESQAQ